MSKSSNTTIDVINSRGHLSSVELAPPSGLKLASSLGVAPPRPDRHRAGDSAPPVVPKVPLSRPQRAEVLFNESNMLVTVDQFRNEADKALTRRAGHILTSTFPNYGWYVRAIGAPNAPTGIGIGLAELVEWGGTQTVMYLNPQSWGLAHEFESAVKKLGGELLERARLHRGRRQESQTVTRAPDGYEGLVPNKRKRYKLVESVDELVKSVQSGKVQR